MADPYNLFLSYDSDMTLIFSTDYEHVLIFSLK